MSSLEDKLRRDLGDLSSRRGPRRDWQRRVLRRIDQPPQKQTRPLREWLVAATIATAIASFSGILWGLERSDHKGMSSVRSVVEVEREEIRDLESKNKHLQSQLRESQALIDRLLRELSEVAPEKESAPAPTKRRTRSCDPADPLCGLQ